MKYPATFIFISFIGMAVFGFTGMATGLESGHANCIALAVNQTTCPESAEIFAFSSFHSSAFKKFSTAFLVAVFLSALFLLFTLLARNFGFRNAVFSISSLNLEEPAFFKKEKLQSWLSLHEASPHLIKGV